MLIDRRLQFHDVLDIPEQVIGQYRIVHIRKPAESTLYTATDRTQIIGGDRKRACHFTEPTRWHELVGPTGVWMSDLPIEQAQHDKELTKIRTGRVLVGGLGLGYAATVLSMRQKIKEVVVVEKSPEIIQMIEPYLGRKFGDRTKITLVEADLFAYLKVSHAGPFDWAFYDIWQSDSENTFFRLVLPLLKLSDGVVDRRPVCWNENVMRGQLYHSLHGRIVFGSPAARAQWSDLKQATWAQLAERTGSFWHDWSVPFFQWLIQSEEDHESETTKTMLTQYVTAYGTRTFPQLWHVLARVFVPDDLVPLDKFIQDALG